MLDKLRIEILLEVITKKIRLKIHLLAGYRRRYAERNLAISIATEPVFSVPGKGNTILT